MRNRQGMPIWYELLTTDAAGSKAFYDDVIGWSIASQSGAPGVDYRMISARDGGFVGGMMPLTEEMRRNGAKPAWLFYIGVEDVDATAKAVVEKGGAVHAPPFDIPGAGRAAMVADPQGNPFYVMRGSSEAPSTAWDRMAMGRCNWNELATTDQHAGNAFYADVFGWTYPHKMDMPGDMGAYMFIDAGGETIGATMQAGAQPDQSRGWRFYFRAPDIEAAAASVRANGGAVHAGPMEVPGGDRIIVASDPLGVGFGVVGPGATGAKGEDA